MNNLINTFESYLLSKRFSENTIKSYLLDVSSFFSFAKEKSLHINSITLEDFRSYFAYRKQNSIKASSNSRAISALKSFFSLLEKNNIIQNSEINKLKFPKLPKTLPRALQNTEILSLINALDDAKTFEDARDRAMIILLYGCGLRVSEALSLKKKDVSKNSEFLKIKGKGGKERIIPVLPIVIEEINNYIKLCPFALLPEYPLFVTGVRNKVTGIPQALAVRSFQQTMQNLREKLNLPKFATPHALRHSFATHIIKSGGNIRNVQSLLGHSSISTTQKYIKIEEDILIKSYQSFHPKA